MSLATFTKQPADIQDYDINFNDWLTGMGDTGASVAVTCDAGITQPYAATLTGGYVKVWASGGTSGTAYKYTVTLTTANSPPRVVQVEITVKVKET